MEPRVRIGHNIYTCWRGGSMQCQTHTHKRIHSVPRDTQGGWNLGEGSDAILTHVSVALPLIELKGFELREAQWGAGMQARSNTHTNTHSVHVTHKVDGASGMDRMQF